MDPSDVESAELLEHVHRCERARMPRTDRSGQERVFAAVIDVIRAAAS